MALARVGEQPVGGCGQLLVHGGVVPSERLVTVEGAEAPGRVLPAGLLVDALADESANRLEHAGWNDVSHHEESVPAPKVSDFLLGHPYRHTTRYHTSIES